MAGPGSPAPDSQDGSRGTEQLDLCRRWIWNRLHIVRPATDRGAATARRTALDRSLRRALSCRRARAGRSLKGHALRVAADAELRIRNHLVGAGETCRSILKALPTWFGIPASVDDYVATAECSPTVVASLGDEDVGLLTSRQSPYAAEVYVMAVLPQHHRQGIGRALLGHAEDILAADGVEFLQVKTLSPSKPDDGYDKTRAFYLAYGFRPLEEFPTLWDADNPALQMIKVIPRQVWLGDPAAICRCARGACTRASSRADAGLPPAPPGSGECGVLWSSPAWHPRPSR